MIHCAIRCNICSSSNLLMKSMACVFSCSALWRSARTRTSDTLSMLRLVHRASSHITFSRSNAYCNTQHTLKRIGVNINEQCDRKMNVKIKRSKIRNVSIRGTTKEGEIAKKSPGKEFEVVRTCDEKRGALRRKEGDANETTRKKQERKAKVKMVGHSDGCYQRERTIGGGSVRQCYMEAYVIVHRPYIKVTIR